MWSVCLCCAWLRYIVEIFNGFEVMSMSSMFYLSDPNLINFKTFFRKEWFDNFIPSSYWWLWLWVGLVSSHCYGGCENCGYMHDEYIYCDEEDVSEVDQI